MTSLHSISSREATCRKCLATYEATEWQTRKRDFICKPCRAENDRASLQRRKAAGGRISGTVMPLEHRRAFEQTYRERPGVRERRRLAARRRLANPIEQEKALVRRLTRREIEAGRLVRQPCEVCGLEKVDAHHDDYSKPFEVRWLCRFHHARLHAEARGEQP